MKWSVIQRIKGLIKINKLYVIAEKNASRAQTELLKEVIRLEAEKLSNQFNSLSVYMRKAPSLRNGLKKRIN
ncbi:hypothetical protein ABH960_003428 [Bacillus sp. RC252]